MDLKPGEILVRFPSHRQRDRGVQALGRKPVWVYSFYYEGGKGTAVVTEDEFKALQGARVKCSRVRKGVETYNPCWDWR